MSWIDDRIKEIEEEIARTPKNKGTEAHLARLKAQLAILRERKEKEKAKRSGRGYGYGVKKRGDATITLVGYPSVGKSSILNLLTNARSEVGDYEFTTLNVIPGMLHYKGAYIQILDIPGIIEGAWEGRGRGREVLSVVRASDLVVIVLDVREVEKQYPKILEELYNAGIRLDEHPPKVRVIKKDKGGIKVSSAYPLEMDEEEIKSLFQMYGVVNAEVIIQEPINRERLVDAIIGNRVYVPSLLVVNKIDLVSEERVKEVKRYFESKREVCFISSKQGWGIEEMKEKIFKALNLLRVYMKEPGKKEDREEPLIVRRGTTIKDIAERLRIKDVRYARVWGKKVKFPAQVVGLEYEVEDEDVVELHT